MPTPRFCLGIWRFDCTPSALVDPKRQGLGHGRTRKENRQLSIEHDALRVDQPAINIFGYRYLGFDRHRIGRFSISDHKRCKNK